MKHKAPPHGITGALLAGGEGRRMGGRDKGLVEWQGRPLAQSVLERLSPQVGQTLIIANRNLDAYRALCPRVYSDASAGFEGPLAGMLSALTHADSELVLCVPCDVPRLPADLAARLLAALEEADADAATLSDGERLHPVLCLLRREVLGDLERAMTQGLRRVNTWLAAQRFTVADFSDRHGELRNCNTPADLAAQEEQTAAEHVAQRAPR